MNREPLQDVAQRALERMRAQGFDAAQASATAQDFTELNVEFNEPSLLRSTRTRRLALVGIVGQRKAASELSDLSDESLHAGIAALHADARAAPRDDAHAVSAGEHVAIEQGPPEPDTGVLAHKLRELMAFRAADTPGVRLRSAVASHTFTQTHTLTSGGSELACRVGVCSLGVSAAARDGTRSGSFNYTGGDAHDLARAPAPAQFGIDAFLRDTARQLEPRPVGAPFVGDVVLTPRALTSLLGWLQQQLGDERLIAHTSLYRERVGERIASPLLTLHSRFDAPGVAAVSAEAFAAPPVTLLEQGHLRSLTPGFYASRRTGLAHVPIASAGWGLAPGTTPLSQLVAGVARGALVDRLSMGAPAASGDFSGVIKNSFAIDGGQVGDALRETMIAGNMARMLLDVAAVSAERIDTGAWCLPWVRIGGLSFS